MYLKESMMTTIFAMLHQAATVKMLRRLPTGLADPRVYTLACKPVSKAPQCRGLSSWHSFSTSHMLRLGPRSCKHQVRVFRRKLLMSNFWHSCHNATVDVDCQPMIQITVPDQFQFVQRCTFSATTKGHINSSPRTYLQSCTGHHQWP